MSLIACQRPQLLRICRTSVSPPFKRLKLVRCESTSSSQPKPFYCTTPIFYVNADPHIGHLHSTLLADVYTRWNRLREPQRGAVMCTGTDEHGLKIQRVAEAKGVSPKELCDGVSERFRDLVKAADVDAAVFIRTTEERHRIAVEHVWTELEKRGYIYKSSYAGWYAVSDEAYYAENQVAETIDPKSGEKYMASVETGTRVEWMEEENYKFKLSAFHERLVQWLSSTPHPVQPPSRTTALLASLSQSSSTDLSDLSISRPSSRLTWGIPVPSDPDHTIYVWIDALVNYLTVAGYPWKDGQGTGIWPPDLQVVGKDIVRFHALYLPAILMALDLPLPKHLLTHGHWTMDRFKMSKSRGNVANPFEAMSLWSIDAIRMYLMTKGGNSASDADYSEAEIERFYKKELAGQMGNLLGRVTGKKMLKKLGDERLLSTEPEQFEQEDQELVGMLRELPDAFEKHISTFEIHRALSLLFETLAASNRHIQTLSPWLSTATPSEIHRSLHLSSESLRIAGILLQPFMPTKSSVLLDVLGVREHDRGWEKVKFGEGGERDKVGIVKGGGGLWPPVVVASYPANVSA
ncbi:methionine--tRNA ligase MSM1 [Sporobolomyces salmoneus]|uniref:methionine--tRNA ligase MSM1 n=1 Tax=Sporobolomyces salmoneus TaxID=183962 RepID=UPI00317B4AD6